MKHYMLVVEATSRTTLRKGDWALIPPYNGPAINEMVNIELGNSSSFQLYNLNEDLGQQKNIAGEKPEKRNEMVKTFEKVRGKYFGNIEQLELK